jgi:hypothetical protein
MRSSSDKHQEDKDRGGVIRQRPVSLPSLQVRREFKPPNLSKKSWIKHSNFLQELLTRPSSLSVMPGIHFRLSLSTLGCQADLSTLGPRLNSIPDPEYRTSLMHRHQVRVEFDGYYLPFSLRNDRPPFKQADDIYKDESFERLTYTPPLLPSHRY